VKLSHRQECMTMISQPCTPETNCTCLITQDCKLLHIGRINAQSTKEQSLKFVKNRSQAKACCVTEHLPKSQTQATQPAHILKHILCPLEHHLNTTLRTPLQCLIITKASTTSSLQVQSRIKNTTCQQAPTPGSTKQCMP